MDVGPMNGREPFIAGRVRFLRVTHIPQWHNQPECKKRALIRAVRAQARGRRTSLDTTVHTIQTPPATAARKSSIANPG